MIHCAGNLIDSHRHLRRLMNGRVTWPLDSFFGSGRIYKFIHTQGQNEYWDYGGAPEEAKSLYWDSRPESIV